ncbi:MAG: TonB family protein [Cyclobacteriaceae bacterium]|nr:TonB family protein [Cyclobacteriaceae bacterium]
MENLFFYQLQVAVGLGLFYLFYQALLRHHCKFTLARFYMLSAVALSFLLPLLHLNVTIHSKEIPLEYLQLLPAKVGHFATENQSATVTPLLVFVWIWSVGMALMLMRLALSMFHVKRIMKNAEPIADRVLLLSSGNAPSFSFFKTIVLSHRHYYSNSAKYILAHEQAHTRQHHSVDVLLMELLKAMQWFNPFAWLLADKAIQNLEYLADEHVVRQLNDKQAYQMAIVSFARTSENTLLRTEFSKSNLKNRIMMMNKPNAQKILSWRLLLLLPLVGTMLMSFSIKLSYPDLKKEVSGILPLFEQKDSTPTSDIAKDSLNQVLTIADKKPVPVVGMKAYFHEISQNLKYPENAKTQGIEGKVYVEFVVRKDGSLSDIKVIKGIDEECDKAAIMAVKNGSAWIAGEEKGKPANVKLVLPIKFSLGDGEKEKTMNSIKLESESGVLIESVEKDGKSPLMILDGKQVTPEELAKRDPQSIESMEVLKDPSRTKEYGEKGKYGVILITSKNGNGGEISEPADGTKQSVTDPGLHMKYNGQAIDQNNPPLIYKDGKEISLADMKNIEPEKIERIEILKDDEAKSRYGEKGKNGVILITLK